MMFMMILIIMMMLMMTLDTMTTMPIIMMMLVCCPEFNKLLLYCVCLYACVCVWCVSVCPHWTCVLRNSATHLTSSTVAQPLASRDSGSSRGRGRGVVYVCWKGHARAVKSTPFRKLKVPNEKRCDATRSY